MARAKKEGKFISCYLDKKLSDKLEDYSNMTKIPKTAVIENALERYLQDKATQEEGV